MSSRKRSSQVYPIDGLRWIDLDPRGLDRQGILITSIKAVNSSATSSRSGHSQQFVSVRNLVDFIVDRANVSGDKWRIRDNGALRNPNLQFLNFSGPIVSIDERSAQDELRVNIPADMERRIYDSDFDGVVNAAERILGIETAGIDKYYGTNALGAPGFYSLPTGSSSASDGPSGTVQFADGTGGFVGDGNNFYWDNNNKRLGVGTNSPLQDIDVIGNVQANFFIGDGSLLTNIPTGAPSAGMLGAVQYSDGAGAFLADDDDFYWDPINKRLGVGTSVPLESIHTTGNVLAAEFIGSGQNLSDLFAAQISFNPLPTTTPLVSEDVQSAIEELDANINAIPPAPVDSVFGRTGIVIAEASDYDAVQVDYINTGSGLTSVEVQGAIDELKFTIDSFLTGSRYLGIFDPDNPPPTPIDGPNGTGDPNDGIASGDYYIVQFTGGANRFWDFANGVISGGPAAGRVQELFVGDRVIYNDQSQHWDVIRVSDGVTSVFGRTGAIIAAPGDYNTDLVTEATNLYFTEARVAATPEVVANTAKVSADGSVTTHNDVTDAGSGQIITDAERNALNANTLKVSADGPISTHSNVDAAAAQPGQVLRYDGFNWVNTPLDALGVVVEFNGRSGIVTPQLGDYNTDIIAEGSVNLYYTEARVSANTDVANNTAKISADASIDTHIDVDVSTIAPNFEDVLAWDGTNWIPKAIGDVTTPPGGSNTQVQFNDDGDFGGTPDFTWGSNELRVTGKIAVTGLGFEGAGNLLTSLGTLDLHSDVPTPTPTNDQQVLTWDDATSSFIFVTPSTGDLDGTIAINQVAFGTAPDTIGGDNNFTWDGTTLSATNLAGDGTSITALGSITLHSDVDTVTIPPQDDWVLTWETDQWVPKESQGAAEAADVAYTPIDPGDWVDPDPTNVQEALDSLAAVPPGVTPAAGGEGAVQFNELNGFEGDETRFYWNNPLSRLGIATGNPVVTLDIGSNDAIKIPRGPESARPAGTAALIRYNTETDSFEGFTADDFATDPDVGSWGEIGGGLDFGVQNITHLAFGDLAIDFSLGRIVVLNLEADIENLSFIGENYEGIMIIRQDSVGGKRIENWIAKSIDGAQPDFSVQEDEESFFNVFHVAGISPENRPYIFGGGNIRNTIPA